MNVKMKPMAIGLAAIAALGMGLLRVSPAQQAALPLPGDAELDAVLRENAQQNQPRPGQPLDEIRRLIDDASRIVQDVNGENQTGGVATRLNQIVERLRQLDGREVMDPLASPRERAAGAPLIDPQRMEEFRKLLVELQGAQSAEQKLAASQKIQQALQRVRTLVAKRAEMGAAQDNPFGAPAATGAAQDNPFGITTSTPQTGQAGGVLLNRNGGRAPARNMGGGRAGGRSVNQVAQLAPDNSGWSFVEAPNAEDNDWRQIATHFENQIRQTADTLRTATTDAQKDLAKRQLGELLNQYFDQDLMHRQKELARVEERVKSLKAQLAKRQDKKQEVIALQLKVAENEADGLGFFSTQTNGQSNAIYMYSPGAQVENGSFPGVPGLTPSSAPAGARYVPATRQAAPARPVGGLDDLFPQSAGGNAFNVPVEQPAQPSQPVPGPLR